MLQFNTNTKQCYSSGLAPEAEVVLDKMRAVTAGVSVMRPQFNTPVLFHDTRFEREIEKRRIYECSS